MQSISVSPVRTPLHSPSSLLPLPRKSPARPFTSSASSSSPSTAISLRARVQARSSSETEVEGGAGVEIRSASGVVRDFYDGINRRDLGFVEGLIAENCLYEDLVFSSPFVGRKAIIDFFKKFTQSISSDLQFVIDDISGEDSSAIGVTWHLEWNGKPFPFSKGCSFYRLEILDGKTQIVYGRDCVEPATKPGEFALVIIGGVTSLLQRFPGLADWL
ncbi:hypothetical protein LUZ60_013436 [Juncus effusus]|nr:hypothetical protein LUZ60_013436 [Juncus effusus]